jgi:glucose uptake protein GlcU
MKLTKLFLEILGWLQIALGTTLGFSLIAFAIYYCWPTPAVKAISITIVAVGFIAGSVWATKIWSKYETIEWLSGIRKIS